MGRHVSKILPGRDLSVRGATSNSERYSSSFWSEKRSPHELSALIFGVVELIFKDIGVQFLETILYLARGRGVTDSLASLVQVL